MNPALTIDIRMEGDAGVAAAVGRVRSQFASLKDTLSAGFQLNLGAKLADSILQGVAAFPRAIGEGLRYAASLKDMALQSGLTSEAVQVLSSSAEESGASFESVRAAMTNLRQATVGAIGGNEQLQAAFEKLGIDAAELARMPLAEQLENVARAFDAGSGDAQSFSALIQLLGERNVPMLQGMLKDLAEGGLEGLAKKLRENGALLSSEMIEKADAIDDRWTQLGVTFKKTFAEIGLGLRPVIEMIQWFVSIGLSVLESMWAGFQRIANALGAVAAVLAGSTWKEALEGWRQVEREQRGQDAGRNVAGSAPVVGAASASLQAGGSKGAVDPFERLGTLLEQSSTLTQQHAGAVATLAKAEAELDRVITEGNAKHEIDNTALAVASANAIEAKQKLAELDGKVADSWKRQVDAAEQIERIEESLLPLGEQRAAAASRLADAEQRYYALFDQERIDLDKLTQADLARLKAKKDLADLDERIAREENGASAEPSTPETPEKWARPEGVMGGYKAFIADLGTQAQQTAELVRQGLGSAVSSLGADIWGAAKGTQSWGDSFKHLGDLAGRILSEMIARLLIVQAISFALGIFFGPAAGMAAGAAAKAISGGSLELAGGGTFVTSGPTHLTVGDNPGGAELVSVIPLSGVGQSKMNGQGLHMAGGGTALVDGGRRGSGGPSMGDVNVSFNFATGIAGTVRAEVMAMMPELRRMAVHSVLEANRRNFI